MTTTQNEPAFEALLDFIKTDRGFDLTPYKRPSLTRRVRKRMQELRLDDYEEYRKYLEQDANEFAELFDTILINVTGFFRDAPTWEFVRDEVVPRIVEAKDGTGAIRIWVTGCATGEEAYTIAMILAEALGEDGLRRRVKIYATDVDEDALAEGRQASYTAKRVEGVPPELLEKYFERQDARWVFRTDLRRVVIFGRHDLLRDPPISRVDLVASRNTLMYFDGEAQRRVLTNFHFALRDGGFLVLGKSEVMVTRTTLFTPANLKRRVFVKASKRERADRGRLIAPRSDGDGNGDGDGAPALATNALMQEVGFDAGPVAHLVLDRDGKLALANAEARLLFGLSDHHVGRPLQDLEVSFRPVELRARIEEAYEAGHPISVRDVEWRLPTGESRVVDVQVAPLTSGNGEIVGAGVTFADVTRYKRLHDDAEVSRRDVEAAYEELQSTVEELETTNEELQSTNEELETTNEELESTNEELETMNEELQSTNEELETLNDELNQRTNELNGANAFLESILLSLDDGVAVVDEQMRVTAWNRSAQELWGLRADEVAGEHLLNLDIGLPVDRLRPAIKVALRGETADALVLPATNRRGKSIDCRVVVSPLHAAGSGAVGAIVLMEAVERQA